MAQHRFPIVLQEEPAGGYSVTCPILPGCHSQGDTLDEARRNIVEAIGLVLEHMRAQGEAIPDPTATTYDRVAATG